MSLKIKGLFILHKLKESIALKKYKIQILFKKKIKLLRIRKNL